jgi:myo-inositol-1(or 4)-monophosphatase
MELAVVYLPRTDELFTAQRGKGAFLHHPKSDTGSGKPSMPIHVSERPFPDSIMCTALPVYYKEYAPVCADIIREVFLQCNDIRRFGSAASEQCYLAMGLYELYFEYILSPWDFAAASLILEEAGGVLCDLDGKPLDHTKPSGVLAANTQESLQRLACIVKSHL